MTYKSLLALVSALLITLVACNQSAAPSAKGVWKLQVNQIDVFSSGTAAAVQYLDLSGGGSDAGLYGHQDDVALNACETWPVQVNSSSVTFFPGTAGEKSYFATLDGDSLTLKDSSGKKATFVRVSAVPDEAKCQSVDFASGPMRVNLDVASSSNLTSDGSQLWVARAGDVYPVDPTSGTLGAAQHLTSGDYYHILSTQGGAPTPDFWATDAAGSVNTIKRMRIGDTEVDSIDTNNDLGHALFISSAVYDGSHLWLSGYDFASSKSQLMQVDSDAEPDVRILVRDFNLVVNALTFHGGHLWGLINDPGGPQIIRIDYNNGKVVESYKLPELGDGDSYQGLTSLNGKLYLLAKESGSYNLYSVQP